MRGAAYCNDLHINLLMACYVLAVRLLTGHIWRLLPYGTSGKHLYYVSPCFYVRCSLHCICFSIRGQLQCFSVLTTASSDIISVRNGCCCSLYMHCISHTRLAHQLNHFAQLFIYLQSYTHALSCAVTGIQYNASSTTEQAKTTTLGWP
jgi:hypothetical protein